jgi:hypothetical protein
MKGAIETIDDLINQIENALSIAKNLGSWSRLIKLKVIKSELLTFRKYIAEYLEMENEKS